MKDSSIPVTDIKMSETEQLATCGAFCQGDKALKWYLSRGEYGDDVRSANSKMKEERSSKPLL